MLDGIGIVQWGTSGAAVNGRLLDVHFGGSFRSIPATVAERCIPDRWLLRYSISYAWRYGIVDSYHPKCKATAAQVNTEGSWTV
jgi:hypothetical protein